MSTIRQPFERDGLQLHLGRLPHRQAREAYDRLMGDVLGLSPASLDAADGPWLPLSYFTADGRCIANVDAAILPLIAGGEMQASSAIRSVAVDPLWRGRGLFRDLMRRALAWCDERSATPTMLYTEEAAIYRAFDFKDVPQHAFVGEAPEARVETAARTLDLSSSQNTAFFQDLFSRRAPPSMRCTLLIDAMQFVDNLKKQEEVCLVYAAEHDLTIIYEVEDAVLTLIDLVGPVIPTLASLLGMLKITAQRVKTLFPPDRLDWSAEPVCVTTGLMARGTLPAEMTLPFMLPPTAEF